MHDVSLHILQEWQHLNTVSSVLYEPYTEHKSHNFEAPVHNI